jgi:DNA-binding transcriptional LysR family regulator
MHIETLRTFCDVLELGSVSRAAEANYVTQSAVSQQLSMLEKRYGQRLVQRSPKTRAEATEAGRVLYEEAKLVLERFQVLEHRLREGSNVVSGSVRVATVYSVGLHVLPPLMKAFLRAHPRVNLRVEYRRTNQVYNACLTTDADLGIVALPTRKPQLSIIPLRTEELVLVTPPGHPLARRRRLTLQDLAAQPFIGFDRDIPTRKLIDRVFRREHVPLDYVMEFDNIETIKRSVEAELGISILPRAALASEVSAGSLSVRPFAGADLVRRIGIIHRAKREFSTAARAFIDLLLHELGEARA